MKIIPGFEERIYKEIAKATGNKQIVKDVAYIRVVQYRNARRIYAERLDDVAFFVGYSNSDHFRLVGIGVRQEWGGRHYGKFMLMRAIEYAKRQGFTQIKTRTLSGVDFYQKCGNAKIVGMAGDDYLMVMDI